MKKRPVVVLIVGWLYLAVGTIGFVYHARELWPLAPLPVEAVLIEAVRIMAIVAGAFLLWGANWARWLAVGWLAVHVGISALNSWPQAAMHAAILAVVAWALWRPAAREYFAG